MNHAIRAIPAILLAGVAGGAGAIDVERADVREFVDGMVSDHDYSRDALLAAFREAESQGRIIESISRPAEKTLSWGEYRDIFITDERIAAGSDFWREHEALLLEISGKTGVPVEMLVGIIGVETYFGRITGNYRVLDALTTLAFDYPPRQRFFRRELEEYLLLVREEDMDVAAATGSYAGAMGMPQFMPSSFRAYAVDANDDGRRDIWTDWADVIGSVANYFVAHGWKPGADIVAQATLASGWNGDTPKNSLRTEESVASLSESGVMFATDLPGDARGSLLKLDGHDEDEYWVGFHNFFVVTRYNRSVMYALAVFQLGREISLEVHRGEE